MENWLYDKTTMNLVSGHHRTNDTLPDELFQQVCKARRFMAGSQMLRQLYFGALDMELHTSSEPWLAVLERISSKYTVLKPLDQDRFPCSFLHIFASGYAAGYYSYKWAEMMSADAFSAFEEVGLTNRKELNTIGKRYFNLDVNARFFCTLAQACYQTMHLFSFVGERVRSPNIRAAEVNSPSRKITANR